MGGRVPSCFGNSPTAGGIAMEHDEHDNIFGESFEQFVIRGEMDEQPSDDVGLRACNLCGELGCGIRNLRSFR